MHSPRINRIKSARGSGYTRACSPDAPRPSPPSTRSTWPGTEGDGASTEHGASNGCQGRYTAQMNRRCNSSSGHLSPPTTPRQTPRRPRTALPENRTIVRAARSASAAPSRPVRVDARTECGAAGNGEDAPVWQVGGSALSTADDVECELDFGVVSQLNSRICELTEKLAQQEAINAKKPRLRTGNRLNMTKLDLENKQQLEQEKQLTQKLQAQLAERFALAEKHRRLLRGLQGGLEAKDKVLYELMRQADSHRKELTALKQQLATVKRDYKQAQEGWERAERRLDDMRRLQRPHTATQLHNKYIFSNKELEIQRAHQSARKLEAALQSERRYTEHLEKGAIAASQETHDANERECEAQSQMVELNSQVTSLTKQLNTETVKANGVSEKLAECQTQLNAALRDLSDCRVQLVEESKRRRDAEEKCKALDSEIQVGAQRLEASLSALENERMGRKREVEAHKATRATLRRLQKLMPVSGAQTTLTTKYMDSYNHCVSSPLKAE